MLTEVEYPIRLLGASTLEVVRSPKYFFDNSLRGDTGFNTLQLTLSGCGVFSYQQVEYQIREGQAFLFSTPESSHYYYPSNFSEPWKFCWFTFQGASSWWRDLRMRFGSVISIQQKGRAMDNIMELTTRFHRQSLHDTLHASELIYRAIIALERELTHEQDASPIDRVMELIRLNPDQPWSVKELAERYNISREHFIRRFTEKHGISPGTAMRRVRLERALRLVVSTNLPIRDVARQCGYNELSSFCRAFRQEHHMPPEQFRHAAL